MYRPCSGAMLGIPAFEDFTRSCQFHSAPPATAYSSSTGVSSTECV